MAAPAISTHFKDSRSRGPVKLGLALQGGGSYGAFTAGVVKALMKNSAFRNGDIQIIGISGTSAGAKNGTLITDGLKNGGPDQVIENLDKYWAEIGSHGRALELMPHLTFWARYPNLPQILVDYSKLFATLGSVAPQNYLLNLIDRSVTNWDTLNKGEPKLFTNAIEIDQKSGKKSHVIFKEHCPETVVASANLPEFGPLEFRGHHYYDGAAGHNPSICPLEELEGLTDIMVVNLHKRPDSFYEATHQDDIRVIEKMAEDEFITHHVTAHLNHISENPEKEYHLHEIALEPDISWDKTSRMNTMPSWINQLMKMGERAGNEWIRQHIKDLGQRSSYTATLAQEEMANTRHLEAAIA